MQQEDEWPLCSASWAEQVLLSLLQDQQDAGAAGTCAAEHMQRCTNHSSPQALVTHVGMLWLGC